MIDGDGFSAAETSAAMAASTAASARAAERAGRLGDDVLVLLRDVMSSGEVDDSGVYAHLQAAGAALFRVKRMLAAVETDGE